MAPCKEIVVVDDCPLDRAALSLTLSREFVVHAFSEPIKAANCIRARTPQLAVLDVHLGEHCGLRTLKEWSNNFPKLPMILCSGDRSAETSSRGLSQGAVAFVHKPFTAERLLLATREISDRTPQPKQTDSLEENEFRTLYVGESDAAKRVRAEVLQIGRHDSMNVLILGESGTGKEIVAEMLRRSGPGGRRRKLVAINMAAVPATLLESELFGAERGAYSGSVANRAGKLELADGGDLFLDEIGDLPMESQSKLLRVLQEKRVQRIGSHQERHLRFRAIAATNQPLSQRILEGRFREDLAHRLADFVVRLPPLRERPGDLPLLVEHLLDRHFPDRKLQIASRVLRKLETYSWPGNVRQLESVLRRAAVFSTDSILKDVDFAADLFNPGLTPRSLRKNRLETELSHLAASLKSNAGSHEACWRELGISQATFYRKLKLLRKGGE